MQFIKKFLGYYWTGEVIKILPTGKRACRFNNNAHAWNFRDRLQELSKTVSDNVIDFNEEDNYHCEDEDYLELSSAHESNDESRYHTPNLENS